MRVKWLLFTILLNIFLVLFASILVEYNHLAGRLQTMENSVSVALETAVDTSMMSEEFFSEGFTDRYYSHAMTTNAKDVMDANKIDKKDRAPSMDYSKLFLYRGNQWIAGNTYVMSYYYQQHGKFPDTQLEIDKCTQEFSQGSAGNNLPENRSRATIFTWN